MRLWKNAVPVMLPLVGLLIVGGLHTGCSSAGQSSNLRKDNTPPVVNTVGWSPAKNPLERYRPYTFVASATDPDIGDTVVQYEWDFGDGSTPMVTSASSLSHVYVTASTEGFALKVRATDQRGNLGAWSQFKVPVDSSVSPLTATPVEPTAALTVATDIGGSLQVTYTIKVVDASPGVGTPGGPTIDLGSTLFDLGETSASVVSRRDNLDGTYSFTLRYAGAAAVGTRTVSPKIQFMNTLKIASDPLTLASLAIQTMDPATNHAPTILITNPAGPRTSAYTSKPVDLVFTAADPDGDPLSYSVNWGDGSPLVQGNLGGDTKAGIPLTLAHTFKDAFTATAADAKVVLTLTDNRSGGTATPQSRTFSVNFNTLPTVVITSPQGSATAPTPAELPSNPAIGLQNPAGPNDPDITVIPVDGRVAFASKATPPGSGDAALVYKWTFDGGIPSGSSDANPGEVVFPLNTPGAVEAHLVTVTVTDAFSRSSLVANSNPKTYKKWVVVDGANTQAFNLKFMYRLKTEDLIGGALVSSLSPALTAANGLGATVKIFQDGAVSTYQVQDPMGRAQVGIPVRANLPFYVSIPPFGADTFTYMFRVPNAPIGAYADAGLGTREPVSRDPRSKASAFWFQNPDASTAPWNPVLQVVTGQGFGPEVSTTEPRFRIIKGSFADWHVYGPTPENTHWIDMMTHPQSEAIQSLLTNSLAGAFSVTGLQAHAEWLLGIQSLKASTVLPAEATPDTDSAVGTPTELGFVLDYEKFTTETAKNESFAAFGLQATRVPPHTGDPFTVAWNVPSAVLENRLIEVPDPKDPKIKSIVPNTTEGLAPLAHSGTVSSFIGNSLWGDPGVTPLGGGLGYYERPFERNYPGFPLVSPPYPQVMQGGLKETFSYAEYLWSSHWARPVVLNRASANWSSTLGSNLVKFPYFRFSATNRWPRQSNINGGDLERTTAYDIAPAGTGTFNPTIGTPVGINGINPTPGGVGRFYWTAATPELAGLGIISRTWLSDASQKFPVAYTGKADDATVAYGLYPPQEVVVDKRGRDANGSLSGGLLDGYRITWYNPTLTSAKTVVPPDFYVVEVRQGSGSYHYILPASYPGGAQRLGDPIVTDARAYLPSGNAWGSPNLPNPAKPNDPSNDQVAPGFCWFDVPKDLQPLSLGMDTKSDLQITVFAVKAILRDNSPQGARKLSRVEWMEAIKTVTANMKVSLHGDFTYAHKLPFNYYWDIVVAQSSTVTVKP